MCPTDIILSYVHLGPIEIPANISPHRRALVNQLNEISNGLCRERI